MGGENADSRAGDPAAAANISGKENAAEITRRRHRRQIVDADGLRLPTRRSPIVGQPRLATPSWYGLAVNRWREAQP
jgi:hypothetical protein